MSLYSKPGVVWVLGLAALCSGFLFQGPFKGRLLVAVLAAILAFIASRKAKVKGLVVDSFFLAWGAFTIFGLRSAWIATQNGQPYGATLILVGVLVVSLVYLWWLRWG